MAWTNPKTWSVGETLTAANFNTHLRDNLNAGAPHLHVRKPSDESLASNTTLQNDDHLVLAVTANEVWQCELYLRYTASTVGDIKLAFTHPGGEVGVIATGEVTTGTGGVIGITSTASPTTNLNFSGNGATTFPIHMHVLYVNGASPGNLQLQWAQVSSDGTATIVKAHSTLWAVKLA